PGRLLPEAQPQGWLCLRKLLFFNLSALEEGERLALARLELQFLHNSYRGPSPGQVLELRLYPVSPRGSAQPGRRPLVERSFVQLHKSLLFELSAALRGGKAPGGSLALVLEIAASSRDGSQPSPCGGSDALVATSLLAVTLSPQCQQPRGGRSPPSPPVTPS
ncbi:DERR protein, partial [Grantiella picta]|nr:DERR protein [Grantiella picta]